MMSSPIMVLKPELVLTVFGMVLLIYGAWRGPQVSRVIGLLAIGGLVWAIVCLACPQYGGYHSDASQTWLFGHMLVQDGFARFVKMILLSAAALSLLMSWNWLEDEKLAQFEYPVLVLFATLGMMLMVSAADLLSLYVGLELQSLSLYVLAAFKRDDAKSSESGLKYFILGALSSCLILYGISLIYGFAGTTDFIALGKIEGMHDYSWRVVGACLKCLPPPPLGVIFGLVFICAALAFKVSAVPFHMWTPDVYEGAPTPVTTFFAAAPKVAALALFTRVLIQPMGGLAHQWVQIVVFVAAASMLLGSFAGLVQSNIKRLMAYSSIANVGYALVGLATGSEAGIQALLLYLAIYFLNTLGAFGVILFLRRQGKPLEQISDLSGLAKTNPLLAAVMVVFMFSLAGVPPFAGFFGKYFIFLAAVHAKMTPLAVIGVLTSAVAAFYYLRVIKVMYFDNPGEPIEVSKDFGLRAVTGFACLIMLLFVFYPSPVIDSALAAAKSLTGG